MRALARCRAGDLSLRIAVAVYVRVGDGERLSPRLYRQAAQLAMRPNRSMVDRDGEGDCAAVARWALAEYFYDT
jgi:hypothetical protein